MKVMLQSTTMVIQVNGVPCRIWEGRTDSDIPVQALILRVAIPEGANHAQFRAELTECVPPSEGVSAFPLRMVL